jgi:hypothetical protein
VASDEYNKRGTSWSQQTKGIKGAGVFIANYPEYISNQTTQVDTIITTFGGLTASLWYRQYTCGTINVALSIATATLPFLWSNEAIDRMRSNSLFPLETVLTWIDRGKEESLIEDQTEHP